MITRYFDLNLNAGESSPLVINANQYDQSEQWIFTLYNNGEIYKPSQASIVGIKSDKKGIINSASVNSDGQVVVNETKQMTASAGDCTYELQLDSTVHGTHNFIVRVEPKPADNADFSDSDVSLMQTAIESAEKAKEAAAEATKAVEDVKDSVEQIKTNTSDIESLQSITSDLETGVKTNATNIATNSKEIATTKSDVDTLKTEIDSKASTDIATELANGLMSKEDKTKLDGIEEGANNYTLPNATNSVKGGVIIGDNISVSNAKISISSDNVINALGYTPLKSVPIVDDNGDIIPTSIAMANMFPRKTPKTMTYTELISHLSEIANNDFTNVRLGDIVTFGNNQVYIAEFNRNYTHNGRKVPTIDFVSVTHYDGYGYGTKMNDTDTTSGGFVGSKMYTTTLPAINTDLANYFGSYLYQTQELLTNAVSSGSPSGWSWYGMKARIMSSAEALGCVPYAVSPSAYYGINANIGNEHQQLALFKVKPELIVTGENYWLRDVCTASSFGYVSDYGHASHTSASNPYIACRVCFSIKLSA